MEASALLFILLQMMLHLACSSDPPLSPKGLNYEVAALMAVKSWMRDEKGVMDGWDINSVDPCTWSMVGCSPDGFVISLEMANNGLSGALSPSIGNLSHLQTMLLQNNKISGPIPAEVGKLAQLKTLHLSNNQLIGEIPRTLGLLAQLDYLRLDWNNLSGQIPKAVADLTGLTYLDLSFNNLSGPFPKILAKDYSSDELPAAHAAATRWREDDCAASRSVFSIGRLISDSVIQRLLFYYFASYPDFHQMDGHDGEVTNGSIHPLIEIHGSDIARTMGRAHVGFVS